MSIEIDWRLDGIVQKQILRHLWVGALIVASMAEVSAIALTALPAHAQVAAVRQRPAPIVPKPVAMFGQDARKPAVGPAYSLVDVGSPFGSDPAQFLPGGGPVALNNTGQILGSAVGTRYVGGGHPAECTLWTGKKFVAIDSFSEPVLSSCTAGAFTDEDSRSGNLTVVGTAGDPIEPSAAFLATMSIPLGTARSRLLYESPQSEFVGFGPGWRPIGYQYYAPLRQDSFVSGNEVPAVYNRGRLQLLQPNCAAARVTGCMTSIKYANPSGIIGLCDGWQNCFLSAGRTTVLPTTEGSEFEGDDYKFTFVDKLGHALGNVDEQSCQPAPYTCSDRWTALLYQPKSMTAQYLLPPNCANSYAYSMNESAEVLGFANGCSGAEQSFNWTWTSGGGFKDLTQAFAAAPGGQAITPLNQINDRGQILVTVGLSDWGVLTPYRDSGDRRIRERLSHSSPVMP